MSGEPVGAPVWVRILGAVFGGVTLLGLFAFAYLAGANPTFVCNSFTILAAVFAFGAALAVGFIGGAAAIDGSLGLAGQQNAVKFSAAGGIATFFLAFLIFHQYQPSASACDLEKKVEDLSQQIIGLITKGAVEQKRYGDLLNEEKLKFARLDSELKRIREQDIQILPSDPKSHTIESVKFQYTSKDGVQKPALRARGQGYFVVAANDLSPSEPEIFLEYDPSYLPANRAPVEGENPVKVSVERLAYSVDPLKIRLWLDVIK